jgi:hypothetical protein
MDPELNVADASFDCSWEYAGVDISFPDRDDVLSLETSFSIANYHQNLISRLDDGGWLVGYLTHDDDCQNPLEDCDGMGKILSCRREYGSGAGEACEAAFMDRDGNADIDSGWGHGPNGDSFLMRAYLQLRSEGRKGYFEDEPPEDLERDAIELAIKLWVQARKDGLVGNPRAVVLSSHDYGSRGFEWRVTDPSDQFSPNSPAGVWIPDKSLDKHIDQEIERRIPKEAVVWIQSVVRQTLRGGRRFAHYVLNDGREISRFESADAPPPPLAAMEQSARSQRRAVELEIARECAEQACKEYNTWASEDCWGRCVERFDAEGNRVNDEGDDHCWGFVGGDYAEEVLREEFDSILRHLNQKQPKTEHSFVR